MRRKTVGKKKSAGRKPDFTGRQLLFLQAFPPQWQQSINADKQSDFYNKITSKAIKIWGYHDNYNQDLIDDDQDNDDNEPINTTLEHDDDDDLDAEEVDRRQKIYSKLRTVSQIRRLTCLTFADNYAETGPVVSLQLQTRAEYHQVHAQWCSKSIRLFGASQCA